MDTLMKADIFFFVTTIAVVIVTAGLVVTFVYLIRAARKIEMHADKIGEEMKEAGSEVKEMTNEIRESFLYNLLFKKKRRLKKLNK